MCGVGVCVVCSVSDDIRCVVVVVADVNCMYVVAVVVVAGCCMVDGVVGCDGVDVDVDVNVGVVDVVCYVGSYIAVVVVGCAGVCVGGVCLLRCCCR